MVMIQVSRLAAAAVVGGSALPDLEEDLLVDVLGRPAIAERVDEVAEHRRGVLGVDVVERRPLAALQRRGEGAVGSLPAAERPPQRAAAEQGDCERSRDHHRKYAADPAARLPNRSELRRS